MLSPSLGLGGYCHISIMVLSAVTHSLVTGCKMRKEDPTSDTSMVTRLPHHPYTILVARLLQTQITDPEVALYLTNISLQQPTDSDFTLIMTNNIPSFSSGHCVNVESYWLCIWVWKHVREGWFICVILCILRSILVIRRTVWKDIQILLVSKPLRLKNVGRQDVSKIINYQMKRQWGGKGEGD